MRPPSTDPIRSHVDYRYISLENVLADKVDFMLGGVTLPANIGASVTRMHYSCALPGDVDAIITWATAKYLQDSDRDYFEFVQAWTKTSEM